MATDRAGAKTGTVANMICSSIVESKWVKTLQKAQMKGVNMLQKSPLYAYIPAKDVARARNFYEKTLGLKAKEEYAGGVIYEFGGGTGCFLYPTPNAGTSRASQAFWRVDDVEREVEELKARGVVFEEYDMPGVKMHNSIAAAGGAKTAWFKDSEGNILAVSQRL
jgi:predicted enzyme related to lactoylglutathione lyase